MWSHWVLRTNDPHEPFWEFEEARRAWMALKRHFPEMLFAILMPNHLHLVVESSKPEGTLARLHGWSGNVSQRTRVPQLWQPIPDPRLIADRGYLLRTLRYIALNPCRKQHCRDPLEWYWSTYREMMGTTVEPTQSVKQIARALRRDVAGFEDWFYQYVSNDSTARAANALRPRKVPASDWPAYALQEILNAAAAALRVPAAEIRRRGRLRPLFIHLAVRQGWTRSALLAEFLKITANAVRQEMKRQAPRGIDAAARCLSDPGLCAHPPKPQLRKNAI